MKFLIIFENCAGNNNRNIWIILCRQPEFCKWAFNLPRGEKCLDRWNSIPNDTDILVTHTPPLGHGDLCSSGVRAGCVELLNTVRLRVKPKYHVFGHIHESEIITYYVIFYCYYFRLIFCFITNIEFCNVLFRVG